MAERMNQQVLFKSRPIGEPTVDNFERVERPVPQAGPGQVLRRTIYLSLDPYMRGMMNPGRSYVRPMKPGDVMVGGTVSQVIESGQGGFAAGDFVLGHDGWQQFGLSDGSDLRKLDPAAAPISYYLGVLGMPGMTAYVALLDIGQPKSGETVVVSSAAGAVGSVAGQIAKIQGCRVVGTAGSEDKCRYAVEELGFDACLSYKSPDLLIELKRACPGGIDVYFDNTGGPVLEAALRLINQGARIPLVGLISQYNATQLPPGPNLVPLLVKRAKIQGMIVSDHMGRQDAFGRDVAGWLKEGKIKFRQHVVAGLANAPRAMIGLFHGENYGKLLVQVSDDPTSSS